MLNDCTGSVYCDHGPNGTSGRRRKEERAAFYEGAVQAALAAKPAASLFAASFRHGIRVI